MEDREGLTPRPIVQESVAKEALMSPLEEEKLRIARLGPHYLDKKIIKYLLSEEVPEGDGDENSGILLEYSIERLSEFGSLVTLEDIESLRDQAFERLAKLKKETSGSLKCAETEQELKYLFERMEVFEHMAGQNALAIKTILDDTKEQKKQKVL